MSQSATNPRPGVLPMLDRLKRLSRDFVNADDKLHWLALRKRNVEERIVWRRFRRRLRVEDAINREFDRRHGTETAEELFLTQAGVPEELAKRGNGVYRP